MRFCPNCGRSFQDDIEYCQNCGAKLPAVVKVESHSSTNRTAAVIIVIVLIALIVGLALLG